MTAEFAARGTRRSFLSTVATALLAMAASGAQAADLVISSPNGSVALRLSLIHI